MTKLGLENINIFPETIRSRFRYNGKESIKTCFGAVCTGLYILVMLAFTIYYAIPVINNENPKIQIGNHPTSPTKELFYNETGPLFIVIRSGAWGNPNFT